MDLDLKSFVLKIEELIFEIFVTVIFYPVTLWAVLRRPMAVFNEVFEGSPERQGAQDTLYIYPFILYVLTVVLTAVLAPLGSEAIARDVSSTVTGVITTKNSVAIMSVLRGLIFLPFFLTGALLVDLLTPGAISRSSLRVPFSKFCYLSSPHLLVTSVAVYYLGNATGSAVFSASVMALLVAIQLWYLWAVHAVFASYGCGRTKCALSAVATLIAGWTLSLFMLLLLTKQLLN